MDGNIEGKMSEMAMEGPIVMALLPGNPVLSRRMTRSIGKGEGTRDEVSDRESARIKTQNHV